MNSANIVQTELIIANTAPQPPHKQGKLEKQFSEINKYCFKGILRR